MTTQFFEDYENKPTKFAKTEFLEMSFGEHQVRFVGKLKRKFIHFFLNKGTIECLGAECPICKVNKELKDQYPDTYKTQPAYNASQMRYYSNILDKTDVKVCPNCGKENIKDITNHFPNVCGECGTVIMSVPNGISGKVKVVNISDTNVGMLKSFELSTLDANGNPLGINNFDVKFHVSKSSENNKKTIAVLPVPTATDVVDVPEDKLYDLDNVTIKLTPAEVVAFVRGVRLKDIFNARRATTAVEETPMVAQEVVDNVRESLDALLNG